MLTEGRPFWLVSPGSNPAPAYNSAHLYCKQRGGGANKTEKTGQGKQRLTLEHPIPSSAALNIRARPGYIHSLPPVRQDSRWPSHLSSPPKTRKLPSHTHQKCRIINKIVTLSASWAWGGWLGRNRKLIQNLYRKPSAAMTKLNKNMKWRLETCGISFGTGHYTDTGKIIKR